MPRNGSGVYTLPAGNPVIPGTVIESLWANPTMTDIAVQLNNVITRDGLLGFTAPIKGVDGTMGAPAYSFTAEPSTGMYRAGSGDLRFSVLGADRLLVNAAGITVAGNATVSGNLTVSGSFIFPNQLLLSNGTAAAPSYSFTSAPGTGMFIVGANNVGFATSGILRLGISQSGVVYPGTDTFYDLGGAANRWRDTYSIRFLAGDGTVAAPGLTFNSELGLGWFRNSASDVRLAAQGGAFVDFNASSAAAVAMSLAPLIAGGSATLTLGNGLFGGPNRNLVSFAQTPAGTATITTVATGSATVSPLYLVAQPNIVAQTVRFRVEGDAGVGSSIIELNKSSTASTQNIIWGSKSLSNRWAIVLGDATAESGGNVGSDFAILRYADNGSFIAGVMAIARASGNTAFANAVGVAGNLTVNGVTSLTGATTAANLSLGGNLTVAGPSNSFNGGQLQINQTAASSYSILAFANASIGTRTMRMSFNGNFEFTDLANAVVTFSVDNIGRVISGYGYVIRAGTAAATGANVFNINHTGTTQQLWIDATYMGNFAFTSDERVKKGIAPLDLAADAFMAIKPIRYHFADVGIFKDDGREYWGFSAQNLIAAGLGKAVDGDITAMQENDTPQPAAINPAVILAQTVLMVQDLMKRVQQLETT